MSIKVSIPLDWTRNSGYGALIMTELKAHGVPVLRMDRVAAEGQVGNPTNRDYWKPVVESGQIVDNFTIGGSEYTWTPAAQVIAPKPSPVVPPKPLAPTPVPVAFVPTSTAPVTPVAPVASVPNAPVALTGTAQANAEAIKRDA